jgi:hypothetical protein
MLTQTAPAQLGHVLFSNPGLADIFSRFGEAVFQKERESTGHEETVPEENL